jgi:hypothetical protein
MSTNTVTSGKIIEESPFIIQSGKGGVFCFTLPTHSLYPNTPQIKVEIDLNKKPPKENFLELVQFVEFVLERFSVNMDVVNQLAVAIKNETFQQLFTNEQDIFVKATENIFVKHNNSKDPILFHKLCHDINSFAICIYHVIQQINKGDANPKLGIIADAISTCSIYSNPRIIKTKPYSHQQLVLTTLKLILCLNDLVKNPKDFLITTQEA